MNKFKLILRIVVTILSGAIMLQSMISGKFHFAGNLYEDFQTLDIELQALQAPLKTPFFSVKKGQILSVWFRCAIRQIENKNLKISVFLIDEDENIIGEFGKDFRFGYFHNRPRKVKYYKLGKHSFRKEFRGYLQYELDGTWTPTETSALVLRKSQPVLLPFKQIGFFVVGLVALFVGIETIARNSSTMNQT
jgi:hypothetical protein